MESKSNSQTSGRRRAKALLTLTSVALIIGILLYFEQVAVIYVLSTLGLIILLSVVAFADLEKVGADRQESTESISENDENAPKIRQNLRERV